MQHDKNIFEQQGHLKVDLSIEKKEISAESRNILQTILQENPDLKEILENAAGVEPVKKNLRNGSWSIS